VVLYPRDQEVRSFLRRVESDAVPAVASKAPEAVQPVRPYPPVNVRSQFSVMPRIEALAVAHGELVCSNDDLIRNSAYNWSPMSSDEIREKTGIESRRYTELSLEELALQAAKAALARSGRGKLTGVPRDQLIGTSFSDYFTDPAKAEEIYQRVFTDGMAADYPLTLRHRDGHETSTDVLYNASVYRDTAGNVLGVFAAARDVTEQMRAQREVVERLTELERFQRLTVGRGLKMIELKKEIENLKKLAPPEQDEFDGQG
jgi:PAS domain S-box-containing protein